MRNLLLKLRNMHFTWRLLDPASTPRFSILDAALFALTAALAIALFLSVTRPVTSWNRLETSSVLDHWMIWTTLGTMSGPIASRTRSQPANLLWNKRHAILVDVGDGAAEQIVKTMHLLSDVDAVVLSHLHIDHTGGLSALLGMRYQQRISGKLTIYGPPGTRQLVDGIMASEKSLLELDAASNPQAAKLVPGEVVVVEIVGGQRFSVDDVEIIAVENSHYGLQPDTVDFKTYQSLAFRFDMPDRSIMFTGDTGPSEAVRALATGADLLVSEITDPDAELASLKTTRPDIPSFADPLLRKHFEAQHLTADAVGALADGAGVHGVVITHNPIPDRLIPQAAVGIARRYSGPVAFANDLENY